MFGTALRRAREDAQLSLRALAHKIGASSHVDVLRWEMGLYGPPSTPVIRRIARECRADAIALLMAAARARGAQKIPVHEWHNETRVRVLVDLSEAWDRLDDTRIAAIGDLIRA